AVPGAAAGPAVRGHLHHRPAAAVGAVPGRLQLPGGPAGAMPAAGGKLLPAVVAVPAGGHGWFRVAHRRTAYAAGTPRAGARLPPPRRRRQPDCSSAGRLRQADRPAGVDHLVEGDRRLVLYALAARACPDGQDAELVVAAAADPGIVAGAA